MTPGEEEVWTILENGPKKWSVTVQEDENGEAFIEFPEDFMERVGWKEGDTIVWKDNNDGSFSLTKKQ